jgi:hypothetical protein
LRLRANARQTMIVVTDEGDAMPADGTIAAR